MTPGAQSVLIQLAANPGDDILCCGIECYCGNRRISLRTVYFLLRILAIRIEDNNGGQRFGISDIGRALLRNTKLEDDVKFALRTGMPFTLRGNHLEWL